MKQSASGGDKTAAAASSSPTGPAEQKSTATTTGAANALSVSEKRRMAALIRWEKRRERLSKAEEASSSSRGDAAVPVTPPKGKKTAKHKRSEHPAAAAGPPAKKRKVGGTSKAKDKERGEKKVYTAEERSQAAKRGWERIKKRKEEEQQQQQQQQQRQPTAKDVRRQAVKERKRNEEAANKPPGSAKQKKTVAAVAAAAAPLKAYSGEARRQAAKCGWESRQGKPTAGRNSATSSIALDGASSLASMKPSKPQIKKEIQPKKGARQYRLGTKRSRRLAASSDDGSDPYSYESEMRRVNQVVMHLRLARGWMEFRPSSRHGSGTATYGYVPSSIASFIQSGAIALKTVLEHGTLGVHYALDWEGYGGLSDMLATFGEDYSPVPTEEMMELSTIAKWELGEDLPWKAVEEADKKARKEEKMRRKKEEEEKKHFAEVKQKEAVSVAGNDDDDDDVQYIVYYANILASLDRAAVAEAEASDLKESAQTEAATSTTTCPPSVLALNEYEIPDVNSCAKKYGLDAKEECPLSRLANVAITKEKGEEDVIIIQSRQDFKHWNFGLS